MGIVRRVEFPSPPEVDWPRLVERLTGRGFAPTLRMIDDLPAFPDEVPPPEWRELRLGFAAGMVTLRCVGNTLECVVWGTADAGLTAAQLVLADTLADLGGGGVSDPPA